MDSDKDGEKAVVKTEKTGKKAVVLKLLAGAVCGFINGLFGGGGGMVVVPFLKYIVGYETERAHATTIAVILPLSVASGIFYTAFGEVKWKVAIPVTVGIIAGGIAGAFLLKKIKAKLITVIFSLTMAAAGVKMLFF